MTHAESPSARYECDSCGACCKKLIVEVEEVDVIREPRLIEADPHHKGKTVDKMREDYARGMVVTIAMCKPCPFLGADCRCGIYPTRPNVCVAFEAGSPQCQEAREAEGLSPLLPIV